MKKYIRWLDKWGEEAFVSTMLAFLIGILAIGVFSRFLMNKSFPWVEEVCSYLFIWSSYIGIAIAQGTTESSHPHGFNREKIPRRRPCLLYRFGNHLFRLLRHCFLLQPPHAWKHDEVSPSFGGIGNRRVLPLFDYSCQHGINRFQNPSNRIP